MIKLDLCMSHKFYPSLSHIWFADSADYGAISQDLTFSNSMTFQLVNVSIVNDDLLEIDEVFIELLALVNAADAARVNLQPNSTEVTILDEDSE